MEKAIKGFKNFTTMHYYLRALLPTSYFIYSIIGCVNLILMMYGMTASNIPGSFMTCLVGWIAYCAISHGYSQYMVKKDWRSEKLHNICLAGHIVVLLAVVNYLFY